MQRITELDRARHDLGDLGVTLSFTQKTLLCTSVLKELMSLPVVFCVRQSRADLGKDRESGNHQSHLRPACKDEG